MTYGRVTYQEIYFEGKIDLIYSVSFSDDTPDLSKVSCKRAWAALKANTTKSRNHVCFVPQSKGYFVEYWTTAKGALYRSSDYNAIDINTGQRHGTLEMPAHMTEAYIKSTLTPWL